MPKMQFNNNIDIPSESLHHSINEDTNTNLILESSTFLTENLVEEKTQALHAVSDLHKQKNKLLQSLEKSHTENHLLTSHYQAEIRKRDEQIHALETTLLRAKNEAQEREKNIRETLTNQLKHAQNENARAQNRLNHEISQLASFGDAKRASYDKIQNLEYAVRDWEIKYNADTERLEREHLIQRAALERSARQDIDARVAHIVASQKNEFNSRVADIVTTNKTITNELRLQLRVVERLQSEKWETGKKMSAIKRNLSLSREKERVYESRVQALRKEVRTLGAAVKVLQEENAELKTEREKRNEAAQGVVERSGSEVPNGDDYERLLKEKTTQLADMKRFANTVLEQRGQIEQFLLDSLIHVTDMKASQRKTVSKRHSLPSISAKGTDGEKSQVFPLRGANVDLADLTWDDREKILRLLIAKMNRGY
mmetsp:Transcript_24360/g.29457  ORF Transcript_24360/g.29457 Transcript_24360/m.29457 type:complete len:427 (-) Transcript_24360:151-1431(-)